MEIRWGINHKKAITGFHKEVTEEAADLVCERKFLLARIAT